MSHLLKVEKFSPAVLSKTMNPFEIIKGPNPENPTELFTAESFIEYMRNSSPHWWNEGNDDCPWVFRGQADESWKLVPAAGRHDAALKEEFYVLISSLNELATKEVNCWNDIAEIEKTKILRYWAYVICLERFVKLAGNLSFRIQHPPDISGILAYLDSINPEREMRHVMTSLQHNVEKHPGSFPYDGLEAASIAQHHGIPTFLMDWTENPITACHFAATDSDGNADLAVWALNANLVDNQTVYNLRWVLHSKANGILQMYRPPKSENRYLASQSGVFTTFLGVDQNWADLGEYPCLAGVLAELEIETLRTAFNERDYGHPTNKEQAKRWIDNYEEGGVPLLKKMVLPADQIAELQLVLYRENITKAHMMPTLDNVAETSMNYLATKKWS